MLIHSKKFINFDWHELNSNFSLQYQQWKIVYDKVKHFESMSFYMRKQEATPHHRYLNIHVPKLDENILILVTLMESLFDRI